MRVWLHWLWIIASSLAVVGAAGSPFLVRIRVDPPEREPEPRLVEKEVHYYVLLSVVEVEPKDDEGETWDSRGGAPDLAYEIRWQGQRVFESSTKDDTLVARWTNVNVSVTDLIKNGVSLDDSIKAARITVRGGEEVEFVVYDKDVAADDLIGRWSVPVDGLEVGDQKWERPGGRVVSAVCRVLPLDAGATELIK